MSSSHFFGKLSAAENMEVEMLYRLASIIAAIGNDSVAVTQLKLFCDRRNNFEDMRNVLAVLGCDAVNRSYMALGYYEHVNGRLRSDIIKGVALFVLVNLF